MKDKFLIISLALILFVPAQAEVLDKFGGCRWPPSIWILGGFSLVVGALVLSNKKAIAKKISVLSGIYIMGAIIWPFLAAQRWVPSWYDAAKFDFYKEVQSCPQFEVIGYWQSIWVALFLYILVVLGLLFASRTSG